MGVSENSGFSPQIIHFDKVFHYFHHPFWGFPPIFGNIHIIPSSQKTAPGDHPLLTEVTGLMKNMAYEILVEEVDDDFLILRTVGA